MSTPESYVQIERRPMDLADYIDVARRHRGWILGPIFAGIVVATVIAFLMPNTYVSQASLRITPAQISENILANVITQQMVDRINQMEQDILSRTSLSELIQRPGLDLYRKERDRKPLDDVIDQMRSRDVKIQIISVPGASGNRPAPAFSISFAYPDRYKAKATVDALVTRFMESNLSQQELTGAVTTSFLKDEVQQAKSDLDRLNSQITDFRRQNAGILPEQAQMNGQALAALQSQRASLDEALNRDSQEKIILENRLETIRSQRDAFATLSPQAADDPSQTQKSDRIRELNRSITEAEHQLAAKRQLYTDSHPDVIAEKGTLEALRKQRDEVEKEEASQNSTASPKAPNTHKSGYLTAQLNDMDLMANQAKSQLQALEVDRSSKTKQLDQINRQISQYQSRLESAPINEQRYVQLMNDEQSSNAHYQDLLKKQNLAEANQQAQVRRAGENLEVLDPASLPQSPVAPNRWLIVGIGFAAGAFVGLATAGFREIKDTSLKNLKDVRAYTQLPILGSVPFLENNQLVQKRRRATYVAWSAAVLAGLAAVSASLLYHFVIFRS